jgi:RNA polymerase sigma-70 factor (sigma-E family)
VDRYDGFREFVLARSAALGRTAYLLTGDHGHAQDLLQNALTKTASRWATLRDGNPEGYTRRVLYTEFVSAWRRRRKVTEVAQELLPERPHPDDESERAIRRIALQRALALLAPRQRAVLVLRYFEDHTETQTADLLGCTTGTVKSTAHHALARLRDLAPELAGLLVTVGEETS